jgi:transposase
MIRLGPKSRTKLNDEKVRIIRALRAEGVMFKQIAKVFGISIKTAEAAAKGITWRHVS